MPTEYKRQAGVSCLNFIALSYVNGEISVGDIVSASIYIKNNSVNSIKVDSNFRK